MTYLAGKGQKVRDRRNLPVAIPSSSTPEWIAEPVSFNAHRPRLSLRTVWISDTHLGTRGCNAEMLLDFLKSVECETLYLIGDIIDGWQLRKGWYWPQGITTSSAAY